MRARLAVFAFLLGSASAAYAQDPCEVARRQSAYPFASSSADRQAQAQVCARWLDQQRAISDGWLAQQRAQAEARQIQADRERQAQARRAEAARVQAAAEAAERARLAKQAQEEAENSPDNICHSQSFAGGLLKAFNGFDEFQRWGIKAVDIEHLTTVRADPVTKSVACHGSFVLTRGRPMTGTLEIKPNVAGELITRWTPDH